MHIKMDIENVIAAFVELMLPRFSDPKTVLVMSFELCAEGATLYKQRRTVYFMFWRPNNYTKVFWNIPPVRRQRQYRECGTWNLSADHDSEWRNGISVPFRKIEQKMDRCLNEIRVDFLQEPKLVTVAKLDYSGKKQNAIVEFIKK